MAVVGQPLLPVPRISAGQMFGAGKGTRTPGLLITSNFKAERCAPRPDRSWYVDPRRAAGAELSAEVARLAALKLSTAINLQYPAPRFRVRCAEGERRSLAGGPVPHWRPARSEHQRGGGGASLNAPSTNAAKPSGSARIWRCSSTRSMASVGQK